MFAVPFCAIALLVSLNAAPVHAEHPLTLAGMDILARVEQLRKRQEGVAAKHAGRRDGIRAPMGFDTLSTTAQYINVHAYNSTDCNGDPAAVATYGSGICMPATSSDELSTQSTMYYFSSEVLYQSFYSDASCNDLIYQDTYIDFSSLTEGVCHTGGSASGYYSVTSSFSLPNQDGFYTGEYISDSTCNAESTPFFVYWATGDYLEFDDIALEVGCVSAKIPSTDPIAWTADAYVKAGTTTYSSSSSSSCFSGAEHVQLASGMTVRIDEVQLGDEVLGSDRFGKTIYSEVISVPHSRNNNAAVFTRLQTASGKDVLLTPEHLILVDKRCEGSSVAELMAAGTVMPGFCLVAADQSFDTIKATNEVISHEGIYTIVLKDTEFVVVNGFVASPFATNHAVANAYYNVIRALPSNWANSPLIKKASLVLGTVVSNIAV